MSRILFYADKCINSIDRALLNEGLLEEILAVSNIRVFFQRKVLSVDFDRRLMTARDGDANTDFEIPFDFCVGADGSFSVIRRQLMRVVRYAPYFCFCRRRSRWCLHPLSHVRQNGLSARIYTPRVPRAENTTRERC